MKPRFLVIPALALATALNQVCTAETTLSAGITSKHVRDDAEEASPYPTLETGLSFEVPDTGFGGSIDNYTELFHGGHGTGPDGANETDYGATYTFVIDEAEASKASIEVGTTYYDYRSEGSSDEWSLGAEAKKVIREWVSATVSVEHKFETASDRSSGYNVVGVSAPMKWKLADKVTAKATPSLTYNEGKSRLDAAFILKLKTAIVWATPVERLEWTMLKLDLAGAVDRVHDERDGKFTTVVGSSVDYKF